MSEEKPTFKITDRRLFNPDGSPRPDVVREEEPQPPAPDVQPSAAAEAREDDAAAGTSDAARAARAGDAATSSAIEPSQEFLMLVEFVASFAADAMGMVSHPGDVGRGINLPLAKQCIDMLAALREKTDNNLAPDEQQFLETLLSQLRMQYVSLSSAPRPPQGKGGGFTGGDITGGM